MVDTSLATVPAPKALPGPNYLIEETLGVRSGSNLFHSFNTFNIGAGESATFTASPRATTANVISRVTGGSQSTINGLLRSTVPGADVYLINPQGVVLGPTARIDVPAAFYRSGAGPNAGQLPFVDGSVYDANLATASRLTIAAPQLFGFLQPLGFIQDK